MDSSKFTYQTESRTVLADLYTPVGVYMRLRDLYPQSALMESSDYHDSNNSHSFIGICPIASIAVSHGEAVSSFPDGSRTVRAVDDSYRVDMAINDFLARFDVTGDNSGVCGLYGYTSFNAVRYFEHIGVKDATAEKNDAPDMLYILYRDIIMFDLRLPPRRRDNIAADGRAAQGQHTPRHRPLSAGRCLPDCAFATVCPAL